MNSKVKNSDATSFEQLSARFMLIVVMLGGLALRGYALTMYWVWFVVEQFDVPELGIWQSVGILFMVGFLSDEEFDNTDKTAAMLVSELGKQILRTLVYLAFGWLIHSQL